MGALTWLPSIDRWAAVVSALVRPGGRLFVHDVHPLSDAFGEHELVVEHSYFEEPEPYVDDSGLTYTDGSYVPSTVRNYSWNHSLGEIVTAVIEHGLVLERLEEHDWTSFARFGWLVHDADQHFSLPAGRPRVPLSFSLVAVVCRVEPASAIAGAARPSRREGDVERVEFETIVYEKDGAVARIVLNMPEKANIQTAQQVWDMDEALDLADRDEDVKVLVLKANGDGFCAGHAIVGLDEMPEVYPTTGPTPERTWKTTPLRSVPVAAAAAVGVPQGHHRPGPRLLRGRRAPCTGC